MKNALVICDTGSSIATVTDFLGTEGFDPIYTVGSSEDGDIKTFSQDFDLILISLSDLRQAALSAVHFANATKSCVVVICPKERADELSDKLSPNGVLVISRPINRHLFHHYLQFTDIFKRRMLGVWQENHKLKHMVEEIKIIDRAKYLLMQCLSMTEQQAHQYLQRQAMDMRISKYEAALSIIRTYS